VGTNDQHLLASLNPVGGRQVEYLGTVQSAGVPEVDVFNAGAGPQLGDAQIAAETPVLSILDLPVDEQTETVLESQRLIVSCLTLLEKSAGHAFQSELVEFVQSRVGEHEQVLLIGNRWRHAGLRGYDRRIFS
jgi:hypothetical protein